MVFGLLDMQPVPKAVLSALAFHSNNDSGQSWPSVPLLARETGYKETAVKNALKLLEAEEFISKVGTKPCKNGEVNVWEINGVAVQRGFDTTGALYVPPQGRSTAVRASLRDGDGVARRRRNSSVELSRELVIRNSLRGNDDAPHLGLKARSTPEPKAGGYRLDQDPDSVEFYCHDECLFKEGEETLHHPDCPNYNICSECDNEFPCPCPEPAESVSAAQTADLLSGEKVEVADTDGLD
jgi:hypothetical protein